MSKLVAGWLLVSSLVVLWDAGFVMLRPRSMPDGDLEVLWRPYRLYIQTDTRYGDLEDDFVVGQSWCNLFEVLINVVAAFKILKGHKSGLVLALIVSTMTLWKTVVYMIQYTPLCPSVYPLDHLDWSSFIWLFLVPNGVWIVVPLLVVVYLGWKINSNLSLKFKKT